MFNVFHLFQLLLFTDLMYAILSWNRISVNLSKMQDKRKSAFFERSEPFQMGQMRGYGHKTVAPYLVFCKNL